MKNLGKIAGINIIIILVYDILLRLGNYHDTVMFISMVLVAMQVVVNLILSIIYFASKDSPTGLSYFLTMFLVLIIGFGVCVAHF